MKGWKFPGTKEDNSATNPPASSVSYNPLSTDGDFSPRTWIFFYLICLVAILWATFLLVRDEMIWMSFTLVILSAGSGMFLFVHDTMIRTWFFFYLICLTAILWAVFLIVQEDMIWISIFLVIISVGMSIFAYFLSSHHLVEEK